MNEDKIKDLIKVWYNKARSEGDVFSKFVFLWFCFNAWLDYKTLKKTDAEMIKDLADKSPRVTDMLNAYNVPFNSGTEVFKNNLKTLTLMSQQKPIEDVRGRKKSIRIKDENDFSNIVWAIYRIRCNLFHGGKEANDPRDLKLVMVAQRILDKWLGNLIAQWNQ